MRTALACLGLLLLVAPRAFADQERMPPDGLVGAGCDWVGCSVAILDEDPDGPGTDWATAANNNTPHSGHFSFGTPTEPLTSGADLQEFRASVREDAACGNGTPTVRIELWEANTLVRAGPEVGVTATNGCTQGTNCQVVSFTWNATEVASAADVEVQVIATNVSGSPANRCSVDLGAVEWNADVTPAGATPASLSNPTSPFANISNIAATLGATIDNDNGDAVTDYGTVWGASAAPTGNALSAGTSPGGIPPALPFSHARDLSAQPAGTQVFYRGYADNAGGRAYSPDGSFYLEPNQATSLNITNVTDTAVRISWTLPGTGSVDGTIVIMKQGLATDAGPTDGVAHVASSVFGTGAAEIGGTGNYVVFRASGTQVDVTGLTPSTTYAVSVYTYAGPGAPSINYQQDAPQTDTQATTAPASTATLTTPTSPFATITAAGATLGATISNDNGDAVTAYGTVWGASASPTGNALNAGTTPGAIPPALPFSHARDLSAQTPGTQVFFRGFADNGAGRAYSPDGSFYLEPNQATGVSFSNVTDTAMRVSWTLPGTGAGDGAIVVMKQAATADGVPTDGTAHSASSAFATGGTEIGPAGNYVVFRASGTQVDVTGLTASTTYAVAVYTYAGATTATNYQQDAPQTGAQATGAASALALLSTPTSPFANITSIGAALGATIDDDNGDAVTAYGTVWGAAATPTGNALSAGTNPGAIPPALPFSHARDLSAQTPGTQVFFRGYADNGAGRAYSPDGSFYLEPNQATGVSFANVTAGGMQISWTLPGTGPGDGAIVVMKLGVATDADPVDGTAHGASAVFGSGDELGTGNFVVFRASTGTLVNVSGLAPNTTYAVAVYTYAGSLAATNYQQDAPQTGTQATLAGGAVPTLSTPTVSAIGATTATLGATITAQGGDAVGDYGTVWDTVAAPTANPAVVGSSPGTIPPSFPFSGGRTGLPGGTLVTFRGYATNSSGTGYSPDGTFQTEPATQAQQLRFQSTRTVDTQLDLTWVRGSGDGVIVLMQESLAVDTDPVDGDEYTFDTVFGNGQQLGTGNYVVYVGPASGVTVTGIFADITYHAAVYEYSGSGAGASGINYVQINPALGSSGHNASHGVDCVECHFGTGALHGNFSVPRDTVQEGVCATCHNETGPAQAKKDIAIHTGTKYSTVVDCGSCHEVHNNFDFTTTDTHTGGVTAANVEWIRPNTTKYRAGALEPALFQNNTGSFAWDDDNAPWNGLCQNCHQITDWHRNDNSLGAGSHAHNAAADCLTCHPHLEGFRGSGGDCTDCHKTQREISAAPGTFRRQITESTAGAGDGEFSTNFTSHHVNDGTGSQIVTKWDCVVCHAEGDAVTGDADGAYHQKDGVQLKDVDAYPTVAYSDWSGLTPVQRSDFCLSCHDTDGATAITSRTDPDPDATTDPLNPFNDAVANAHEADGFSNFCEDLRTPCGRDRDCTGIGGGTCLLANVPPLSAPHTRGRCSASTAIACGTAYECPAGETCEFSKVVDVWSQVDPTQTAYHALESRSTPAYGSAAPFGSPVDNAIQGVRTDLAWNSLLNCEDCHMGPPAFGGGTVVLSGHGTVNARYMLRDKDGNDTNPVDPNTNCYRCHIPTGDASTYTESLSAYSEHDLGSHIDDTLNLYGIACLNCHGGAEFGGIHGMSGPVSEDSSPSLGSYEPNVFTWGGALDYVSTWAPTVTVTCSSRSSSTLLNNCTQHGSTKTSNAWRGSSQTRTYRVTP